jgi:uncharacterized radical SAM superfamily Fe-S cluster-containing enzyme
MCAEYNIITLVLMHSNQEKNFEHLWKTLKILLQHFIEPTYIDV